MYSTFPSTLIEKPRARLSLSTVQRTARLLALGFELANHSIGLVVEGGEDSSGFSSA
jgi:hypothetical protein